MQYHNLICIKHMSAKFKLPVHTKMDLHLQKENLMRHDKILSEII